MQVKRGPRSAYKSHNAAPTRHGELQLPRGRARRGPPTTRGLQSHVQASLVNSARARAASKRASDCQRVGGLDFPARSTGTKSPRTPRRLERARPQPCCSPVLCKRSHHPAPRPPSHPGAAAWLHCSCPHARPRPPENLLRKGVPENARKQGKEGSQGGRGRGGSARGESHQRQAWPGLLQHHVGLFAIYKRRDSRPPAADKSSQGLSGSPGSKGRGSPGSASKAQETAADPVAKKGERGRRREPCVRTRAPAQAGWPGAAMGRRGRGGRSSTHLQSPPITSFSVFLKCCKEGTF